MGWFALAGAVAAWSALWVALTVAVARRLGVEVAEARIGLGPSFSIGRRAGCDWRLGSVPLGAFVRAVDDAPVPPLAGLLPAVVLALVGVGVGPHAASAAVGGFLVPLLTFGAPEPPGLLHGLAAGAAAAGADPIAGIAGAWAVLGLINTVNSALQALTRFGAPGILAYTLVQVWWLVGLVRGLVLDVWGA